VSEDPFPADALAANRRGRLTPDQMRDLGRQATDSARTGVRVALVLLGFGLVLVAGAGSGRIPGAGPGPVLLGMALVLIGGLLLVRGGLGRTGRASVRAAAGEDVVELVHGELRKERRRRDGPDLTGAYRSFGADAELDHYLHVGDRRFSVSETAFHAAPADCAVRAYVLPGTDHLVNLERTGPARAERQGMAVAAAAGSTGPPSAPSAAPLAGEALRQALIGRWWNSGLGIEVDLGADGVALAGRAPDLDRSRWAVTGPGEIRQGDETFRVTVDADGLIMIDEEGAALRLRRA